MTKIPFFFFLLLLCFTSSSAVQRHLLHQPFFPVPVTSTASPPSPAPSPNSHHHHSHHHKNHPPPPPEKHTFSSVSTPPPSPPHHNPFFPSSDPSSPTSSHSPPSPPPPASLPTFPANISSLLFPSHTSPSSKPHHTRLITITASVISAASLLSLLTLFIIFLRRSRHSPIDDTKSIRSDSLQLFNGAPSDGLSKHKQPPKYTSSNTSSEFLYLGTLVNSTSTGLDQTQKSPVSNTTGVLELPAPASSSSSSSYSQYHNNKIGSPELRPLPPLPKLPSFSPRFQSSEQLNPKRDHHFDGDDIENDEFFSPRGSSGRKLSPPRVKDSGSNSSSPSNSVSSLNDSPVVKLSSPPLKRVCPVRPPPPPPLPPHPLQFSVTSAATSLSPPNDDVEKLEEKKEESLKPKLKALHWDKVRASSSRATVWDQIKSNSFQ